MIAEIAVRRFEPTDAYSVIALWNTALASSQPWNEPKTVICRKLGVNDRLLVISQIRLRTAATNPIRRMSPSSRESVPPRARAAKSITAATGTARTGRRARSNSIGTISAVTPKAREMATMAAPMIDPRAIPLTFAKEPTAPRARFCGSNPMKTTVMMNAETAKPAEVPATPVTGFSAKEITRTTPATERTTEPVRFISFLFSSPLPAGPDLHLFRRTIPSVSISLPPAAFVPPW